jgi:hypothetical protein
MTITLRLAKGSPLTFTEMDGNFSDLLARFLSLDSTVASIQTQLNGLSALQVTYNNTFSGLLANSVQGAIDEEHTYSQGIEFSLTTHKGAADPHPQYTTATEAAAAAPVQSVAGRTGAVVVTKSDVGLSNVNNTSDLNKPISTATQAALNLKENVANKGVANGYASLDNTGKVPSTQLPSYVDDVLEFANFASFPATGTAGIIYVDLSTGYTWRWGGSAYTQILASPGTTDNVVEGATNKYFTETRVRDTLLTGLSTATSTPVVATDSILTAFGKLVAQVDLLKDVAPNARSAPYTLALTDRGLSVDTSANVTIPDNATVAFPVGATIAITNVSGSAITISTVNDTLRLAGTSSTGARTLAAYGLATIRKVSSTVWIASGMGLT